MLWAYAEAKHATPALFVELGEAAIEGAADFDLDPAPDYGCHKLTWNPGQG